MSKIYFSQSKFFLLAVIMLVYVCSVAQAPFTFHVTNFLTEDLTGPWTVDYDDPGFINHDGNCFTYSPAPTYPYHDYAYLSLTSDGATTSICTTENVDFLNSTDGVTVEFSNFQLVGFSKVNTVNALLPWNIYGQAGDQRVYANGQLVIKYFGETKVTMMNTQVDILTPYITKEQVRALHPGLMNWQNDLGTGAEITATCIGTVDWANSDAQWAAAIANPENNQVRFDFSNITYIMNFPPSYTRYTYDLTVIPAPVAESQVNLIPTAGIEIPVPQVNMSFYFNSFVTGGKEGDLGDLNIKMINDSPAKDFAYAQKYWQIFTTMASFDVDITFDVSGESLGLPEFWRLYHRVNSSVPWQLWTGNFSLVDANSIRAENVTSFSEWTVGTLDDTPLPVSLSSFTASFISNSSVLSWITQSEINNAGWNVYRSHTSLFCEAQKINPSQIEGAGTTSEITTYTYTDQTEFQYGETYYYWLESVDYANTSILHGPASVDIPEQDNLIPDISDMTKLAGNYPNPFNPLTNIHYYVKKGETATLQIYNVKGQLIHQVMLNQTTTEGSFYKFEGTQFGSGVYFYRLKSDHYSEIKKMLMLK
jgi:hypothetical protein